MGTTISDPYRGMDPFANGLDITGAGAVFRPPRNPTTPEKPAAGSALCGPFQSARVYRAQVRRDTSFATFQQAEAACAADRDCAGVVHDLEVDPSVTQNAFLNAECRGLACESEVFLRVYRLLSGPLADGKRLRPLVYDDKDPVWRNSYVWCRA
jgi:hypothetical protein